MYVWGHNQQEKIQVPKNIAPDRIGVKEGKKTTVFSLVGFNNMQLPEFFVIAHYPGAESGPDISDRMMIEIFCRVH